MSESEGTRAGREEVWIEKYRPRRLDDIVGQEAIVERLVSYVERDDLPHMLFAGQAGIGKCATGETPIITNEGVSRMASVVGPIDGFEPTDDVEVLTFTDSGKFEYVSPSHRFSKVADEVVEVTTRDGAGLTVTPEHKLLVLTAEGLEWQRAEALDPGDRLVRPLETPLPETDSSLHWIEAMDGEETIVHVSRTFAHRHEIPCEQQFVGTKREVLQGLEEGLGPDEIAGRVGTSREEVMRIERELEDLDRSVIPTTCSLSYLRSLDCDEAELRDHVEAIQNVSPENNTRSPPIEPVWEVDHELASLVGLAVAGSGPEGNRIKLHNTDEALLDRFESAVRDLFGVDPDRGSQHGVEYVAIYNKTLTNFLSASFDVFEGAVGGEGIGSTLVRADASSRSAFLKAVFDAEGHVTEEGVVELTQKSEDFVTLLSYLLAGFGVPARRPTAEQSTTNGSETERTCHRLVISSAAHLDRFQQAVGFSVAPKAERLARAARRRSNPNHDTVPTLDAVDDLCSRLSLEKGAYIPATADGQSHGRTGYLERIEELVADATELLESVQEALADLEALEPELQAAEGLPSTLAGARDEMESVAVRSELADETDVRPEPMLEYAGGDRTPYAKDAGSRLDGPGAVDTVPEADVVRRVLADIVENVGVPHARIAERTELHSSDIGTLLDGNDNALGSMTRFRTVADALRDELTSMASKGTLAALSTLHRVVEADVYLDKVETVRRVGDERRVYDLTVPETHNYVAGAVPTVMHNTTAAQAVARELYGEDWAEHFLELNASDERGIDVVRDRIKSFARTSFGGANYRIIFLDEADALTSDAQSALRRTMEQFSNNVRFILSCNYSSQIIDPIQSRCAVFRFASLADEAVEEQIRLIAEAEDIELTQDGVDALVYAADGDMRRAINGLQAAAVTGDVVDESAVYEITSTARPEEIREMVTRALDGDFTGARSELDRLLTDEGIAGGDILDQLHRAVWEFDLDDEAAVRVLDRIGEADYRITEGANERVQLEALLASLALSD